MSPEIYQNKQYDYKSDVWALGCVLYELITLKHAFDANSMAALSQKVLRGNYVPIPKKFSSNLCQLISDMLQVNPAKRPTLSNLLTRSFVKGYVAEFICSIIQRPSSEVIIILD